MSIKPLQDASLISVFVFILAAGAIYYVYGIPAGFLSTPMAINFLVSSFIFLIIYVEKRSQKALFREAEKLKLDLGVMREQERSFMDVIKNDENNLGKLKGDVSHFSEATDTRLDELATHLFMLSSNSDLMFSSLKELKTKVFLHRTEVSEAADKIAGALSIADNMVEVNKKVSGSLIMIPKITAQINLVALNATIEASRAGDVGKGFAVVANEVKKLAMETFDVTKNITQFLDEGQVAAQQANELVAHIVNVMHGMKSIIENTSITLAEHVENIEGMKETLESLTHEINNLRIDIKTFSVT